MFRVYDSVKGEWVIGDIYMALNGDLVMMKKVMGLARYPITLDSSRYVCHISIDLQDVNNEEVFEGDYIRARVSEDKEVVGLVCYAHELSSYIILCEDSNEFYTLGSNVSSEIKIIGNVFDGYGDKES